jgi:5'-AMP-activated protein kinase, regulatory beta subunit
LTEHCVELFYRIPEETVPTVFSWAHGGDEVYITGSFNNWSAKIPMHRSHDDFSLILDVPAGAHQYKFIVDGDWRYAPDQATVADSHGVVNNTITVSSTKNDATFQVDDGGDSVTYGQAMPQSSEYSGKEPPQLPPHLRFIPLNSTDNLSDPVAMPVPYHVTLNHVYGSGKKDSDVLVLGVTSRYKNKFVTTVYYKPSNRTRFKSEMEEVEQLSRTIRQNSAPMGLTRPMDRLRLADDRIGKTPVAETKEAFFDM